MTGFALLSTTVATADKADALARMLVEARLAACVQITPIRSVYRWAGAVESAAEHLVTCKVALRDRLAVERAIGANHDYAVPEIVVVPIAEASVAYRAWMEDAVAPGTDEGSTVDAGTPAPRGP